MEAILERLTAKWRKEKTQFRANKMTYAEKQRTHYLEAMEIIKKELGL